jgi:hypothetical protein
MAATMASATLRAPVAWPVAAGSSRTAVASDALPPATNSTVHVHETATCLDQSLLQARQRPGVNSLRHGESTAQIPQVVGDDA